jgi:hypothetical protein
VEKANGLILAGIKPRLVEPLERSAGCWVEELPSVLWSLRTTPNRSVGFTPFFLVYGAEAVLPMDIEFDAPRIVQYTETQAKEAREDGVDLLEEAREQALARSALYQQQLRQYHSRKIRPLAFREGDLVLRLVQGHAQAVPSLGGAVHCQPGAGQWGIFVGGMTPGRVKRLERYKDYG